MRARLRNLDRLILVWLYRLFPSILNAITVVKQETVIRWHQRDFRVLALEVAVARWPTPHYPRAPSPDPAHEPREPAVGAPGIRGELLMLGIEVAQSTVAKYTYYNRVRTHLSLRAAWLFSKSCVTEG